MNPTGIGYIGTGADGRTIEAKHVRIWSPGGFGCTGDCAGCYAKKLSKRLAGQIAKCGKGWDAVKGHRYIACEALCKDGKGRHWTVCEKCAKFEVHLHEERLDEPRRRKKPSVVLVNFFADTFGPEWEPKDISSVLAAAEAAPQHTYVWLTKNPSRMAAMFAAGGAYQNWFLGCTIRDQTDADEKLPVFLSIPGNKWISYEPATGGVDWSPLCKHPDADQYWFHQQPRPRGRSIASALCGIIIGHDNRKGAPGTETLANIRTCIEQCEAAGVNRFVKQYWHEGKLYRASHPEERLVFPAAMKVGARLPWSLPEEA